MEDSDLTAPAAVNDAACLSAHVSVCVCMCERVSYQLRQQLSNGDE